ncbi:hypothetical protein ACY2HL_000916 [Enterobacter roggenkampii]
MFWSSKKEVPVDGCSMDSAIENIKMLSKDSRDLAVVVDEFEDGKIDLEEFIGRSVSVITKEVVKSRKALLKLDIMTW